MNQLDIDTDEQERETQGYVRIPSQLLVDYASTSYSTMRLVNFIALHTIGWQARWVVLTHDEFINGRWKTVRGRMQEVSGLKEDKSIRGAIKEALAMELIETRSLPEGTAYAIHRRYWWIAHLIPKWEFFGKKRYNFLADPLNLEAQQARLLELQSMPYEEYLRTPEWRARKEEALKTAKHRCQVCNSKGWLNVHHRTYERRGNEHPEDVIVLCKTCHQIFHEQGKLAR